MRVIYETLTNGAGEYAVVRGRNPHGEYVVSLYHQFDAPNRYGDYEHSSERYYASFLDDAINTAHAMVFRVSELVAVGCIVDAKRVYDIEQGAR